MLGTMPRARVTRARRCTLALHFQAFGAVRRTEQDRITRTPHACTMKLPRPSPPGFGGIVRSLCSCRFFSCDGLPSVVRPIAMRSFVRARAVFLLFAGIFACMTGVRVAQADGSSTSTPPNVETDDARFQRLKAEGDRALAEKRLNDAIKAYDAAREIRKDPLTAGRMGLAISFFDDPRAFVDAASMLYEAVADAAGATSQEKDAFFAAYKRVRKKVCKLSIDTNDANARIDLVPNPA
jgi:hypothetical protein